MKAILFLFAFAACQTMAAQHIAHHIEYDSLADEVRIEVQLQNDGGPFEVRKRMILFEGQTMDWKVSVGSVDNAQFIPITFLTMYAPTWDTRGGLANGFITFTFEGGQTETHALVNYTSEAYHDALLLRVNLMLSPWMFDRDRNEYESRGYDELLYSTPIKSARIFFEDGYEDLKVADPNAIRAMLHHLRELTTAE